MRAVGTGCRKARAAPECNHAGKTLNPEPYKRTAPVQAKVVVVAVEQAAAAAAVGGVGAGVGI